MIACGDYPEPRDSSPASGGLRITPGEGVAMTREGFK